MLLKNTSPDLQNFFSVFFPTGEGLCELLLVVQMQRLSVPVVCEI